MPRTKTAPKKVHATASSSGSLAPRYLAIGSLSAVLGDAVAFPLDTLKVRMQANPSRGGMGAAWAHLLRDGGVAAVFRGLSASAFRQSTYGGTRMFLYAPIRDAISPSAAEEGGEGRGRSGGGPSFQVQLTAGALAGLVASAIFCPADVVKIRLQAGPNTTPPPPPPPQLQPQSQLDKQWLQQPQRYRGVAHALSSIVREEGVRMLWRGVGPTATRASVVAAVELGTYDASKEAALRSSIAGISLAQHPTAAYAAASVAATLTSVLVSFPLDTAKTIMISQGQRGAPKIYRHMGHCLWSRLRDLGPLGVYRGCLPSFSRSLLCNVVLFLSHEHIKTFVESL